MTITPEELRRRLDGIRNLPTLPDVYAKVQAIIQDPNSSARDVGAVVAEDPALTARLLKMVNSAFYGMRQEVSTIDHAVVVLGTRELEHVILATTVLKVFPHREGEARFNLQAFWRHALGTAIAAREVSRRMQMGKPEELFTMGLLHDIGKIVLDLYFQDEYAAVLDAIAQRDQPIGVIEEELLGFDHAAVGSILAAKWELPPRLVDVIQHHHAPLGSDVCRQESAMVNLADMLCRVKNWGYPGDPHIPALAKGAREAVGLDMAHVAPLMQLIEQHFHDGITLLDLD